MKSFLLDPVAVGGHPGVHVRVEAVTSVMPPGGDAHYGLAAEGRPPAVSLSRQKGEGGVTVKALG